jgi:hypothetical protein
MEKRKLCFVFILTGLLVAVAPLTVTVLNAPDKIFATVLCSVDFLLILISAWYGLFWMENK